jgi:hypothetical protein
VIWWPGVKRWRRSLTLRRGVGWKRLNWDLHSAMGFWSFGFTVVFAVSGLYLCIPDSFHSLADWLDPPADGTEGLRFVDSFLAGLAYSHFGRINGIGISCSGPGLCDQTIKAIWAVFGMAPAALFVTGMIMWWNRVLQPWRRRASSPSHVAVRHERQRVAGLRAYSRAAGSTNSTRTPSGSTAKTKRPKGR